MIEIVRSKGKYLVFKLYEYKNRKFARVIHEADYLYEANEIKEDLMPANNVGSGNIAGMDIGLTKKYKKKKPNGYIISRYKPT